MVYASNEQFVQRSGIGLQVIDENVGKSSGSGTQSFDLDNTNITAGTYTLNSGTTTSNVFTALTETTHYTLDKESGRVVITPAGSTFLGTNNVFSTYWHTDKFSDDIITELVANAHEQVDLLTGKKWDTATNIIEYYDGRKTSTYPTTDNPYQGDYDQPDFIVLKKWPITKIDNVFFLSNPISISKFFNYDLGTTTYTDKTTEINSSTETPFTLFNSSPATGDMIYIGSSQPFLGLDINLSTVGVGASTIDWEYYNGTTWADITETETDTGASIFTASGKFTWSYPYGWSTTTINSETLYWIRGTLTDNYTTDPIVATMTINDSVSTILEPRQLLFRSNGILNFIGATIPDGQQNVRVDYCYGETTTPAYIEELTILIASLQAYINLSGGSYDDATSYTLGSKSVTIGEVYVNIREVITQFKKRIQEIINMIGGRGNVRGI